MNSSTKRAYVSVWIQRINKYFSLLFLEFSSWTISFNFPFNSRFTVLRISCGFALNYSTCGGRDVFRLSTYDVWTLNAIASFCSRELQNMPASLCNCSRKSKIQCHYTKTVSSIRASCWAECCILNVNKNSKYFFCCHLVLVALVLIF